MEAAGGSGKSNGDNVSWEIVIASGYSQWPVLVLKQVMSKTFVYS